MASTIQPETIQTASKFLGRVASGKTYFLVPSKKNVRLVAGSEGNVAMFNLPCTPFLESAVEIERDALLNAIKNRKELTFNVEGGTLVIKAPGYTIDLAVVDAPSFPSMGKSDNDDEATSINLSQELWEWIAGAIGALKVSQTASNVEVCFYVRINEKGGFAVAYDMNHMAFKFDKKVTSDETLDFMLPFEVASVLVKDMPVVGTDIKIAKGWVKFKTAQLGVQLALMAESMNGLQTSEVLKRCLDIPKQKGVSVQINAESLKAFVGNGSALAESKTSLVEFKITKKEAKAELRSASGKVSATMKAVANEELHFAMSFQFLSQFLEKAKESESIDLTVVPEAFATIKHAGVFYVAGLAQPESHTTSTKKGKKATKSEDEDEEE